MEEEKLTSSFIPGEHYTEQVLSSKIRCRLDTRSHETAFTDKSAFAFLSLHSGGRRTAATCETLRSIMSNGHNRVLSRLCHSGQLLRSGHRHMSTQTAKASQIPDDPDILTTQDPEMNQSTHHDSAVEVTTNVPGTARSFPLLQYRAPALGVNPAYDLALELIKQDKTATLNKYYATNQKIKKLNLDSSIKESLKQSQIRELTIFAKKLRELADMNDPEVHWRHRRGDADLSNPTYLRLALATWSSKPLHLLIQRITQMSVIPDVIPKISPTVDVRLLFNPRTRGSRRGRFEVGEFLNSTESAKLPKISIQSFEMDVKKLYTLAIVDPDVPNESTDSFTSYLHYLRRDISISPTSPKITSTNGTITHDYLPPHPHKGTNYHRYTVIVWEQPNTPPQPNARLADSTSIERVGFSAQSFARQNGLHAVGMSFWRQVWDDKISDLMRQYPEANYVEKVFKRIKA
jgi:large subunit ribosomal protein L35